MKKLLTILLTLVMAVTLINLNNSHTKAEETNGTTYEITFDGTKWTPTDPIPASLEVGDMIRLKNTSGAIQQNAYVYNGNFNALQTTDTDINPLYKGASVVIDNTNKVVYVTDVPAGDPVPCTGITFDGTDWKNGAVKIDATDASKNPFGIKYVAGNPGTVTFSKSLKYSNGSLLTIKSPVNVVIDDNISFIAKYNVIEIMRDASTSIDGKGHELKAIVENTSSQAIVSRDKLTLKNITLICESSLFNDSVFLMNNMMGEGSLYLQGNVLIEITNKNSSGGYSAALQVSFNNDIYFAENATVKTIEGVADGDKTKQPAPASKGDSGKYVITGTSTVAKYIKIVQKASTPKPSPEPQPKDESCEKVIGPTWHWNNEKGVCEEYATVGTHTR